MNLKEKYFLIVSGKFDREPIILDEKPTDKEIIEAIQEKGGESARIERRYVLPKS